MTNYQGNCLRTVGSGQSVASGTGFWRFLVICGVLGDLKRRFPPDTHKVPLLVEAGLQGTHYGVFGERPSQVDQVLHVLRRGAGLLLVQLLLTSGESKAKGQGFDALAGIRQLRLRDKWHLLALCMADRMLATSANGVGGSRQVSRVGGAHWQCIGV